MYFAVRMTDKLRYNWHEMILAQSTPIISETLGSRIYISEYWDKFAWLWKEIKPISNLTNKTGRIWHRKWHRRFSQSQAGK